MQKEETRFASGNLFEGMVSLRTLIENRIKFLSGETENDRKILTVYLDREKEKEKGREYAWIRHRAAELGFEVVFAERSHIDDMTVGASHGGVAVVCSDRTIKKLSSDDIIEKGFYVMLDGIEDPYNFGYSLRSLYAAGVSGIILGERNWMTAAGVVCRASAGASEMLPLYVSDNSVSDIVKKHGYKVVCADLRNSQSLYTADLSLPLLLVVGGEKRGISRAILDSTDIRVRIDYGREFSASLSAASAATVVGFEVFRQNHT